MNPYPTEESTKANFVVLDVGALVHDFSVAISDHLLNSKSMSTPREIVTWAFRYLLISNNPVHIAEAVMIETCSHCDTRRLETVRKIDKAVVRMCAELVTYCRAAKLYDNRAYLVYELVGWINDTTPFVMPLGTRHGIPSSSSLVAPTGTLPRWRDFIFDNDNKLPF